MEILRTSRFRQAGFGAIIAASIVLPGSIVWTALGLLILFGLWNAVYLFLVPRSRLFGGILLTFVSLFPLGSATSLEWVGVIGLLLFAQGNWLAFIAAARLDE